jgi:hypothetical protein
VLDFISILRIIRQNLDSDSDKLQMFIDDALAGSNEVVTPGNAERERFTLHYYLNLSKQTYIQLQEITEINRTIAKRAQLFWRISIVRPFCHLLRPFLVDTRVVPHHEQPGKNSNADEAKLEGVP